VVHSDSGLQLEQLEHCGPSLTMKFEMLVTLSLYPNYLTWNQPTVTHWAIGSRELDSLK
jgi:hypothetical protein